MVDELFHSGRGEKNRSTCYCLMGANEVQLFGWQMLPEVANISLSVLATVSQCKIRKLLVCVTAPLGPEATVLLVPA